MLYPGAWMRHNAVDANDTGMEQSIEQNFDCGTVE